MAQKLKSKPVAARARRFGGPVGIILFFFLILASLFFPKDQSQRIKEQLLLSPQNFPAHLQLAKLFLENHQFHEAGRTLLLAEQIQKDQNKVLGASVDLSLDNLWQEKHYNDPQDIQKLIVLWEEIVREKKDYRDGYLQLAILNYKIRQNEKAKEFLNQALIVDPNFPLSLELEKIIPLF